MGRVHQCLCQLHLDEKLIESYNMAQSCRERKVYLNVPYSFPLPQAFKNEDLLEFEELKKNVQLQAVKTKVCNCRVINKSLATWKCE